MQAMFGHDPPISFRSITAVRRPALAMAGQVLARLAATDDK